MIDCSLYFEYNIIRLKMTLKNSLLFADSILFDIMILLLLNPECNKVKGLNLRRYLIGYKSNKSIINDVK